MNSGRWQIDTSWTLFLDRDGVINQRIIDGYVTSWDAFHLLPGVTEALTGFATLFGKIIVVTNQQGIGKGIMTEEALQDIHRQLISTLEKAGGRIDAVFHSPSLEREQSVMRKPAVGMALKARKTFPEIRFKQSIMAGDSLSDMLFGRRLGMKTVLISTDNMLLKKGDKLIDAAFPDLLSFAHQLTQHP